MQSEAPTLAPTARVPIAVQLAAARRELAMRQAVYPKWVEGKKVAADKAQAEVNAMASIVANLEFQAKHIEAFRRLALEIKAAEALPEVQSIKAAFPGTAVTDVREPNDDAND